MAPTSSESRPFFSNFTATFASRAIWDAYVILFCASRLLLVRIIASWPRGGASVIPEIAVLYDVRSGNFESPSSSRSRFSLSYFSPTRRTSQPRLLLRCLLFSIACNRRRLYVRFRAMCHDYIPASTSSETILASGQDRSDSSPLMKRSKL